MTDPKPGEVWRSVAGIEVLVRRVWTKRGGDRMVEVKGKRAGRSGASIIYFFVRDFAANWQRLAGAS